MLHDLHLNTIQFVLENKYRMEEGEERVPGRHEVYDRKTGIQNDEERIVG